MTQTVLRGPWPEKPVKPAILVQPRAVQSPTKNKSTNVRGIAIKNYKMVDSLLKGKTVFAPTQNRARALKASVQVVLQQKKMDHQLWPSMRQTTKGYEVRLKPRSQKYCATSQNNALQSANALSDCHERFHQQTQHHRIH